MKKFLIFVTVLLLLFTLVYAQQRAGNIEGKILTSDDEPMPGVLVVLTSTVSGKMQKISNENGIFRFNQLAPGKTYQIVAELEGFKKFIQPNIAVNVGANTMLTVKMVLGMLKEEITVEGKAPVVDTKSTSVGATINRTSLQSIPTGRDPFSILAMAPGVQSDRINMAGSESGQQATAIGKGEGTSDNTVWSMDGVNITDPTALGGASYFDFDAFEEMNIETGGSDVTAPSGGVQMNLVTRRGGNKTSFGGRFYMTDSAFQDEFTEEKITEFNIPGTRGIRDIKDFGFNIGGALVQDKIFYWMSYGVQDIKTKQIYGANDDTLLKNYAFKLNLQLIEANRLEVFLHIGGKTKEGRNSGLDWPEGLGQGGQSHFGSPTFKIQDELTLGDNLFLSLKYSYVDNGFKLWSMIDPDFNELARINESTGVWTGSYYKYDVKRPKKIFSGSMIYFNDNLAGGSHEIKIGAEYIDQMQEKRQGYSGAGGWTRYWHDAPYPQFDIDRDGNNDIRPDWNYLRLDRELGGFTYTTILTGYLQDTMSYGNLTFKAGVRYDKYTPSIKTFAVSSIDASNGTFTNNFDSTTIGMLEGIFPGAVVPDSKPSEWEVTTIAPRISATYDIGGDGKDIVKLAFNRYGGIIGTATANNFFPQGTRGYIDFIHNDANGDGMINFSELYWYDPASTTSEMVQRVWDDNGNFIGDVNFNDGYMFGGWDFNNPTETTATRNFLDGQYDTEMTSEVLFTYEKAISNDFSIALNGMYRRTGGFWWNNRHFPNGTALGDTVNSSDWYGVAGTVPSDIPGSGIDMGDAAGREYYLLKDEYVYSGGYMMRSKRPDYYQSYMGFDLVLNKRLSNKWMAQGSLTYQNQSNNYGEKGYLNPTNLWAEDGQPFAPFIGGSSGKEDQYVFSRWMMKLSGLYQLPWDVDFSFNFLAKEGNILQRSIMIRDYSWSNNRNSKDVTVLLEPFGDSRLDTIWNLDIKLQKKIKIGNGQVVYLMIDIFNAFNNIIVDGTFQLDYGTLTRFADGSSVWTPNPTSGATSNVIDPRVFRLGVRFQF